MDNDKPAICLENICFNFGSRVLFKDLNLRVGQGELVALTGSTGIGKSTLLRIISKQVTPSSGTVSAIDSGMVFQHSGVFPWLTCSENIEMFLPSIGQEVKNRVDKALNEVGLVNAANQEAGNLSGGQMQLLQIARLLAMQKRLWLLDEPFTGLSAEVASSCKKVLKKEASGRNATILLVSHNSHDVETMADKIIKLHSASSSNILEVEVGDYK